jgi:hypothetical protein
VIKPSPRWASVEGGPRARSPFEPSAPRGDATGGHAPVGEQGRREILRQAEALEIPWERILLDEIQAEQTLRRYAEDGVETPFSLKLSILPSSFLSSWRLRDQIQALSCAARGGSLRSAIGQLRLMFRRLVGDPDPDKAALVGHLSFAYQRVLLLQRVCRIARKSRGTTSERMAFVCSTARCGFDDAAWALCREDSARPGHRLDAAIQKVREEGFRIPRASTEARSFAELRRIIRASPRTVRGPRRSARLQHAVAVSVPRRVGLPADAV